MSTRATDAAVERLKRHFGGQLDKETLEAVLSVCEGDAARAIQFLTASTPSAGYDPARLAQMSESSIPEDYPGQRRTGAGVAAAAAAAAAASATARKDETVKLLFLRDNTTARRHFEAQNTSYGEYVATLLLLLHQGVEVMRSARPRVLAAAWARHDHRLADHLLAAHADTFQLPQVLAALEILDARRQVAQLTRKLTALQRAGCHKASRLGAIRSRINELEREDHIGSLSGALAKHVRAWVRTIPAEQLAFFALALPAEPWRQLADLIHLSPRDFPAIFGGSTVATASGSSSSSSASTTAAATATGIPQPAKKKKGEGKGKKADAASTSAAVPVTTTTVSKSRGTFLNVMYGEEATPGSLLHDCRGVHAHNLVELVRRFPVPYSYLRTHVKPIPDEAKPAIAKYMTLDHLIWYYEELACPEVNVVLLNRLKSGETPKFGYGKLMERLLFFKSVDVPFADWLLPIAEERLKGIQLALDPPVVVQGDASYSMDVAIRCSTIIGSVLAATTNAHLEFFNDRVISPPVIPRNIAQVLEVTRAVRADGMTAPAVALWPYVEGRRRVKFMIVVTDEVENVKSKGEYWPSLYARYKKEVAPDCTVVFVSFLENPAVKGRMVTALENMGIEPMIQFRLDGTRPDLTKLDALLGLLSSESQSFPRQVQALAAVLAERGLEAVIQRLRSPIIEHPKSAVQLVPPAPASAPAAPAPVVPAPAAPAPKPPAAAPLAAKALAPAGGPAKAAHENLCVVCLERPADVALLECAHMCACEACAPTLKQCPICRRTIVRVLKVFRS